MERNEEVSEAGRRGLERENRPRVRRFSWLALSSLVVALVSALWCALVIFSLPLTIRSTLSVETGGAVETSTAAERVVFAPGPYFVVAAWTLVPTIVSFLLARVALGRIRARWPELRGLGVAVTGLWFLPLFTLNWLCGLTLARPALARGEALSLPSTALFAAACVALDAWWIAHQSRRLRLGLVAR